MKITDIKKAKGYSNRYHIYVDSVFFATVMDETVVKYNLKVENEYTKDELSKIIVDSQYSLALDSAFGVLEKYAKTEKQMVEYLTRKGFAKDVISLVIKKLKWNNYLDDLAFCKFYVLAHPSKSKKALQFELRQKGVENNLIDEALQDILEQKELALEVAKKYAKSKQLDAKLREKLFRHLLGKGFKYDEVCYAVEKVVKENESWD